MTSSSAEPYRDETAGPLAGLRKARLRSEIESGRRNIGLAILVIAVVTLPMLFVATRDGFATGLAAAIVLLCGGFVLLRFHQAGEREQQKLLDRQGE